MSLERSVVKVSTWGMGYGTNLVSLLGADTADARFRIPDGPRAEDPIRLVDVAVRAVLDEFRLASSRQYPGTRVRPDGEVHVCLDKLYLLRHAETLPSGIRTLRIGPGTVVTPLARDHLRRRGIAVLVGLPESARIEQAGEWAFSIGEKAESGAVHALRRALAEDPRAWYELPSGLAESVDWLLGDPRRGALFITTEPAIAVWKACQVPGIRSATVHEPAEVHSASGTLGINLLVVNPTGKSISWVRQLAVAFRQGGAPRAPDLLVEEDLRCGSPR